MLDNRDYMRRERPSFGGGGGLGSPSTWSVLTWVIAINLAVFVLQNFIFPETSPFWDKLNGTTWVPGFGLSIEALKDGEIWRIVTHMFVHSGFQAGGFGFIHLVFNMIMIWVAGRRVLEELGSRNFLLIYLIGGICGAALQLLLVPQSNLIGASGCAFALLLAFTSLAPEQRLTVFVPIPVELRSRTIGRAALIISAVLGVLSLLTDSGSSALIGGTAHFDHLGGALFGLLFVRRLGYSDGSVTSFDLGKQRERSERKNPFSRRERPAPRTQVESDVMERYDDILDKVSAKGMQSITKEERAILDEVSERLRAREGKH